MAGRQRPKLITIVSSQDWKTGIRAYDKGLSDPGGTYLHSKYYVDTYVVLTSPGLYGPTISVVYAVHLQELLQVGGVGEATTRE